MGAVYLLDAEVQQYLATNLPSQQWLGVLEQPPQGHELQGSEWRGDAMARCQRRIVRLRQIREDVG